jgi:hypothetical protein
VLLDDAGRRQIHAALSGAGAHPEVVRRSDASMVRLKLSELRLERPRQWGACWLALTLWRELQLDRFRGERLTPGRKGTRWDLVLFVLVAYRLIAPGSECGCCEW